MLRLNTLLVANRESYTATEMAVNVRAGTLSVVKQGSFYKGCRPILHGRNTNATSALFSTAQFRDKLYISGRRMMLRVANKYNWSIGWMRIDTVWILTRLLLGLTYQEVSKIFNPLWRPGKLYNCLAARMIS